MSFLGGYQDQSEGDILSGISPEGYLNVQRQTHFMRAATCIPPHEPFSLSTSAPWSSYSVPDNRIGRMTYSDEVLFAPEQIIPSRVPRPEHIPQPTRSKSGRRKETHIHLGRHGTKLLDGVGSPPSGNPVGSPPNACKNSRAIDDSSPATATLLNKKGGRHGRLDPRRREATSRMRKIKSCWHCIRVRGRVR